MLNMGKFDNMIVASTLSTWSGSLLRTSKTIQAIAAIVGYIPGLYAGVERGRDLLLKKSHEGEKAATRL